MRWASIAACIVTCLSGCDQPKPNVSAEAMRGIRAEWPGMTERCAEDIHFGRDDAMNDTARCFKMIKPQRWRRLWLDVFEGQRFCPAPALKCEDDGESGHIWLSFPHGEKPTGRVPTGKTAVRYLFGP